MMPSFEFRPGPRLVIGESALARLGELARELGGTRALVMSDPGIVAAGHAAAGTAALEAAGIATALFTDFGENPTTTQVDAGTEVARAFRPDILVGLGGGSSMDCAKGVNFLFSRGGRMQDYRGRGNGRVAMLPSIAVPTTAGTGSETQSFALITDAETGMKMACGDPAAAFRVAILDVELTLTQPAIVTAVTGIDAVAHAIESCVSTAATPASRMLSSEAWKLLAHGLPRVVADGGNTAARADVQLGAAWAGLAIENAMLGAAHALANPLTASHHVIHGQAVGLVLPHVVRFNASAVGQDYADLLTMIGVNATPATAGDRLAAWLDDLLGKSGLARSLRELRITPPDVPSLARMAATQWTGEFNPRRLSSEDWHALYEAVQ
jgi:alcohol dehydrogenase